jgi:protein-S-isoprenylcysteine O-methyltransferase Ste14
MKNTTEKLNICGIKGIIREFAIIILGAFLLFASAGTLNWSRGWIYIVITLLYQIVYILVLSVSNPQLLNERGNSNWKDTQLHDKFFVVLYPLFGFSALIISGLDSMRFKLSSISFIAVYPGILVFISASFIALWAYISNSSFILTHRDDKAPYQQICTTGPYRYIRHPAYLSGVLTALSYPFIIGSLFSLIPVLLNVTLLIIRTYYEDKTLKSELNGYIEYSKVTKYKLFPHLW